MKKTTLLSVMALLCQTLTAQENIPFLPLVGGHLSDIAFQDILNHRLDEACYLKTIPAEVGRSGYKKQEQYVYPH